MGRRWLRAPALHMLALGALLFGVVELRGGALFHEKPRIEVPAHRLEESRRDFVDRLGRAPDAEEWRRIREAQIDDEVLFRYALALGMAENPAAKARLAQIAAFVEANPHGEASVDEGARAAVRLGLHEGDQVVRRILVDTARRLIRGVVLMQRPRPEATEQFYAVHRDEYVRPAEVRLSHVAINGFKWPDTEARAREVRARIDREGLAFDAAMALADASLVAPSLPMTTERGLEPQLGHDFAAAVMELPVGQWSAPLRSRYGHHLVFVHERREARVPPLDEVRAEVEQRLLEQLADEWLVLRLGELRAEYEIVAPGGSP